MIDRILSEPLFCKPEPRYYELLYAAFDPALSIQIAFRSFDLSFDLDTIHDWVNRTYAHTYWQLNKPKEEVRKVYSDIQRHGNGHSYIGLLNGVPVCQIDVYRVLADEIRDFVTADIQSCGFHLLMVPNEQPIPGLTITLIRHFLRYFFRFPEATVMYAEPDVRNARSQRILEACGFSKVQTIKMSYKTAHLYRLTRQQFESLP